MHGRQMGASSMQGDVIGHIRHLSPTHSSSLMLLWLLELLLPAGVRAFHRSVELLATIMTGAFWPWCFTYSNDTNSVLVRSRQKAHVPVLGSQLLSVGLISSPLPRFGRAQHCCNAMPWILTPAQGLSGGHNAHFQHEFQHRCQAPRTKLPRPLPNALAIRNSHQTPQSY